MNINRQLLNRISYRLKTISAIGRSALEQLMITLPEDGTNSEKIEYLKNNCQPLIETCVNHATALGANAYNVYREMQIGEALSGIGELPVADYSGIIAKSVNNAYKSKDVADINTGIGQFIDSAINHSFADTMINASKLDTFNVRFARVPTGSYTCNFCMMLASRGFVYRTKQTAGEYDKYHAFCNCQIVPEFDTEGNKVSIEGYDPKALYEQYKAGGFGFISDGKGAKTPKAKPHKPIKTMQIDKPISVIHKDAKLPNAVYGGKWNQQKDMMDFLKNVFDDGDYVGTCARFFEKDGRIVPSKGLFQRTAKQIKDVLSNTNNVAAAIGRYDKKYGAYVRINPLDGIGVADANVKAFKYALIEADVGSLEAQYGWIKSLNLPTKAVVTSGSKSVHALVKIDAKDIDEYRERVSRLHSELKSAGFDIDITTKNPSRFMRIPGVKRGDGRQVLVSIDEGTNGWKEWIEWADNNRS